MLEERFTDGGGDYRTNLVGTFRNEQCSVVLKILSQLFHFTFVAEAGIGPIIEPLLEPSHSSGSIIVTEDVRLKVQRLYLLRELSDMGFLLRQLYD